MFYRHFQWLTFDAIEILYHIRHNHPHPHPHPLNRQIGIWYPTLIARFVGPTWGPSGADRTQMGPMLAHELYYLGTPAPGINTEMHRQPTGMIQRAPYDLSCHEPTVKTQGPGYHLQPLRYRHSRKNVLNWTIAYLCYRNLIFIRAWQRYRNGVGPGLVRPWILCTFQFIPFCWHGSYLTGNLITYPRWYFS